MRDDQNDTRIAEYEMRQGSLLARIVRGRVCRQTAEMSVFISELTRGVERIAEINNARTPGWMQEKTDLECVALIRSGDESVRRRIELTTSPEQYARISAMVEAEKLKE